MREIVKDAIRSLLTRRSFQRRLGRLLSHPVTLLAIATLFATVAGAWLTNYYQERAWVLEKQFETFRYTLDEGLKLVDELSEAMSRRAFGLRRVVWVAKGTGTGELDAVWNDYYQAVIEWNMKLLAYKGRLARFIGPAAAEAFGTWEDPALTNPGRPPWSVHAHFFVAHREVRELMDCVHEHCSSEVKSSVFQDAEQALNQLEAAIESFAQACTDAIQERTGAT